MKYEIVLTKKFDKKFSNLDKEESRRDKKIKRNKKFFTTDLSKVDDVYELIVE